MFFSKKVDFSTSFKGAHWKIRSLLSRRSSWRKGQKYVQLPILPKSLLPGCNVCPISPDHPIHYPDWKGGLWFLFKIAVCVRVCVCVCVCYDGPRFFTIHQGHVQYEKILAFAIAFTFWIIKITSGVNFLNTICHSQNF